MSLWMATFWRLAVYLLLTTTTQATSTAVGGSSESAGEPARTATLQQVKAQDGTATEGLQVAPNQREENWSHRRIRWRGRIERGGYDQQNRGKGGRRDLDESSIARPGEVGEKPESWSGRKLLYSSLTGLRSSKTRGRMSWVGKIGLILGPDIHDLKGMRSDWDSRSHEGEWEGEALGVQEKEKLRLRSKQEGEWEGDDFFGAGGWGGGQEDDGSATIDEGEEKDDEEDEDGTAQEGRMLRTNEPLSGTKGQGRQKGTILIDSSIGDGTK